MRVVYQDTLPKSYRRDPETYPVVSQGNYVFETKMLLRNCSGFHVSKHHATRSTVEFRLPQIFYHQSKERHSAYCRFLSDFNLSSTQSRINSSFLKTGALILPSRRPLAFWICVSTGFVRLRILFVTASADCQGRSY